MLQNIHENILLILRVGISSQFVPEVKEEANQSDIEVSNIIYFFAAGDTYSTLLSPCLTHTQENKNLLRLPSSFFTSPPCREGKQREGSELVLSYFTVAACKQLSKANKMFYFLLTNPGAG